MKTIHLVIPSGDMIHADFAFALINLIVYSLGKKHEELGYKLNFVGNGKSSLIPKSRHELAKEFLADEQKSDYLCMIDSDMMFPPDALETLVKADVDVIGCDYPSRTERPMHTARQKNNKPAIQMWDGPTEVFGMGCGFILISRKCLEAMKQPYFNIMWNEHTQDFVGEDYYFCIGAQQAGFKVHTSGKLTKEIGHMYQGMLTIEHAKKFDPDRGL